MYDLEFAEKIYIIKKDGTKQKFDKMKIIKAITKSADRVMVEFDNSEIDLIVQYVVDSIWAMDILEVPIKTMHKLVEGALEQINPDVAKSYKDYRNYKQEFVGAMDEVFQKAQSIMFIGDKENSNADSTLVSTKRCLVLNEFNKMLYKRFHLNQEELQAFTDGYIYIHDVSARRDTMNCCLFNMSKVLNGGFEMGNIKYTEPKSLDVAFDVIGDIILMSASQQYGGFTVPEIDKILEPYAEKTYKNWFEYIKSLGLSDEVAEREASEKVRKEMKQGFQGLEMKLNTVASSRGDYPFVTFTFGLSTTEFGKMASITALQVRREGQGEPGFKKPVLFPKLVFLYDENIHGPGKVSEDVFEEGILTSSKTMYPDWLSLTGEGYVASMYKKYNKVISPMGCVDGKEVITYMLDNKLFVESFERMWARITAKYPHIGQSRPDDIHRMVDLRDADVKIFDTNKGFVKVKYLIRNIQDNWCNVRIGKTRILKVTTDHPFTTDRGVVLAGDLKTSDSILIGNKQYAETSIDEEQDLAWLYGFLLSNSVYNNGKFTIYFNYGFNKVLANRISSILKDRFDIPTEIVDEKIESVPSKNTEVFTRFLAKLFKGVDINERHIPSVVFQYNSESKAAFIAGMVDAARYSYLNTKEGYPYVRLWSTNKEISLQQMALVQSFGVFAEIHSVFEEGDVERFSVKFFLTKQMHDRIVAKKKGPSKPKFESSPISVRKENISYVEKLNVKQYSYDVTTESEHFEVSGVYSHNCRAFLSPWYERGGMEPADENDEPIFVGRFNCGAISLHLPMILAKSRQEGKDFYEVLDYYLELIRKLHIKTYDYLSNLKASCNPLAYCEGGFYGGNLGLHDKIKPLLKSSTFSYGITALNELQQLYNGKSLKEDNAFAVEVMEYINNKLVEYKKEDNILYAVYGTPAESLCGKQIEQFRKKYGIVTNVSDRPYVSNSFHLHVTEDVTPIEKQDKEAPFWNLLNGGKIQYCKYPIEYNLDAIKTLVRRAMKMGYYEGVNLSLSYCDDCGFSAVDIGDECPECGSKNLTKIDRMNGYLSFSRVKGDTRLNEAKMAEIKERKSM